MPLSTSTTHRMSALGLAGVTFRQTCTTLPSSRPLAGEAVLVMLRALDAGARPTRGPRHSIASSRKDGRILIL
jgi:hypothetical protein